LYYRLNLIEIRLPPLAERRDDIPVLATHFLGGSHQLGDDAMAALMQHGWPGNVRELRNCIERARLLAPSGTIRAEDLDLPPPSRLNGHGEEPDRDAIEAALQGAGGNVSRAAQALGLSRQALYRRMERLGLKA